MDSWHGGHFLLPVGCKLAWVQFPHSSHRIPPPRTPDFNVEVFSESPSEGTKEIEQGH